MEIIWNIWGVGCVISGVGVDNPLICLDEMDNTESPQVLIDNHKTEENGNILFS